LRRREKVMESKNTLPKHYVNNSGLIVTAFNCLQL
jgi:hypothetical protein